MICVECNVLGMGCVECNGMWEEERDVLNVMVFGEEG